MATDSEISGARITAEEFRKLAWRGVPHVGQLGCRIGVSEVVLRSDGDPRPLRHVIGTCAIPPDLG